MKYLVLDVGGTAIKYALMTEKLEFLEKGKIKTPRDSIENFIDNIGNIYDKYKNDIEGMALSIPGILDSDTGYMYTGGSLEYNTDKNMLKVLGERCKTKIAIENDGKCAALAELWKGNLQECENGVVILLGTGVGGGIIKDKKLYKGKHFFAGEFSFIAGNINVMSNNDKEWWGSLNGLDGLLDDFAKVKNLNRNEIDGIKFFEYANNDDKDALEILNKFTYKTALAIINLQCILDADKYLIGGGISEQDILIKYIKKNIDDYHSQFEYFVPKPVVDRCKFRNDSNLIGALYNFLIKK
ncbi:ROK family protein [Sarcina ventriculi]|uniref:Beta-glucoside kinase n=1 Tax=Sarcina ventriculi TaxID=1267 RepID=A0ABM9UQM4_SARVE|nr:ROK family protein [Sarcina ventriculi]MBU5322753.1 ROK family protein [Sarcina ventriculi]MDD7372270.1 ROK family protein [Sarcina ventriculi]MDO4402019.1 ROK family protein [Clostridiaceae bacterium]CUN93849.1 Beta-glucoside kinase [Sarcina ventriculi]